MALQTKILTTIGSKDHHNFELTVTENSTSVVNNTSSVSWSFVIYPEVKGYDWISNSGKVKWSVTINGKTYSGIIAKYDGRSTVTIKSSTETVTHNANGSKTLSYSFSITDSTGWSYAPGNCDADDTMALTAIPRQATITAAPNFNDEQNPTITYSNPAGSAVTSLDLCITLDGTTTNSLAYKAVSKTGTSYTYTLSDADRAFLQNATPDSNTLKVGFYLRTVIGGTEYFSKVWKTLTIVNADPILDPVITDTNADTAALTGGDALIRYYSNAYFTTGASAQKGATIKSQSVTCAGVTMEGAIGTFLGVQSGDFVFTVTDSRGNTTTLPVPVPFVEYVGLSCSIGNSKPDTDGNFTLTASGVCYRGDIASAGSNDLYVLYRYKVSGGGFSDWAEMSVTLGDNAYTATANFTGLDYRTTYIFQCKAGDLVTTATTDEVAIKSMPVFDWGENDFRFNVPVILPEGPLADYVVETGTESMGDNGTWYYQKWASGKAECYGCRNYGDLDVSTAWGSLYRNADLMSQTLPSGLFMIAPNVIHITIGSADNGGWIAFDGKKVSTSAVGQFMVLRGVAETMAQLHLGFHIIGRWK